MRRARRPEKVTAGALFGLRRVPFLPPTPDKTTIAAYRHLDTFGWMQLRHRLLEVFQGRRVKVTFGAEGGVKLREQ